jgi:hypothetical protein
MNGAYPVTAIEHLKAKPIAGSVVVGLFAALCCGGSLIFASIGLGVFYSTLGLSRFIPQALAAGAVSIVAINYVYYRQMLKKGTARPVALRQKMFLSTAIGLAAMAGSFVFMEWLNHAVVHGDRFLARPEYSQALIKGVPNITLLYVCATFLRSRCCGHCHFHNAILQACKMAVAWERPCALPSLGRRQSCSLVCW